MLDWSPEKGAQQPVYKQIIIHMKEKIATGQWPVGMRLKPQRELAKLYDVNRSTIVEAIDYLKSEGLLEGQGRRGTVVINNSWSLMASDPPPNWEKYIQSGLHWSNQSTIQAINKLEFDPQMIRLGTGELSGDLYPKKEMEAVFRQVGGALTHLGYESPKGSEQLRKALSQHLGQFGIKASSENILIVSGSLQALQLISIGLLHTGSSVFVEKPSYLKSLNLFQSVGMQLKGIGMDDGGIDLSDLKRQMDYRKKSLLYTIPTFQNPTGCLMDIQRRKALLEYCKSVRLPVIEDDAYRELWLDEPPPPPIKAFDDSGHVLYMGTLSKILAPGLRIGWLVGPEPVVERLGDIKMQTDYGASSISQAVAAQWLMSGHHGPYAEWLRAQIRTRRDTAMKALEAYMKDLGSWHKPKGGFYIWVKLNRPISMKKLFKRAADAHLLINPGEIYDFENNAYIRISYAYADMDALEYGIKRLSEVIRRMY